MSALICASWYNSNIDAIQLLLDAGLDINAKDKYVRNSLLVAVCGDNSKEVIQYLINSGEVIHIREKLYLKTRKEHSADMG